MVAAPFRSTSGEGQELMPPHLRPAAFDPPADLTERRAWEDAALARQVALAIVRHRLIEGMSKRELADKLGWQLAQLTHLERGKYNPRLSTLQELASKLRVIWDIEIAPDQGVSRPGVSLEVTDVRALPPARS
jgi:ribosome-binding protein aMBF1 (putative translation factor)